MHAAAAKLVGLNVVYRAVPVAPEEWDEFARQAEALPLKGLNVTVPHKELATRWPGLRAQRNAPWAGIGAVNTLSRTARGWEAHNTDVEGFFEDCGALGISFAGRRVLLLGAGGAARAILFGFSGRKTPASVRLIDSAPGKAEKLADQARFAVGAPISIGSAASPEDVAAADVVINATPVGLKPGDPSPADLSTLRRGAVAYDLIYHRLTAFRLAARNRGAADHGGLGMLVRQGARSFEIWFGDELRKTPGYSAQALRGVMREAAENAMKEKS